MWICPTTAATPFETILRRFDLDDRALGRRQDRARPRIADEPFDAPAAVGFDVLCRGLSMVADDTRVLAVTSTMLDGLYEYRRGAILLGRQPDGAF